MPKAAARQLPVLVSCALVGALILLGATNAKSQPSDALPVYVVDSSTTTVSLAWPQRAGVQRYVLHLNSTFVGMTSRGAARIGGLSCGETFVVQLTAIDVSGDRSGATQLNVSTAPCDRLTLRPRTKGAASRKAASVSSRAGKSASQVLVSTSPTRETAVELAGRTLSGDAYIFMPERKGLRRVSFYVDDQERAGAPYRIDGEEPYDLAGGTTELAAPFATGLLSAGEHTITAVIEMPGKTEVVDATFVVVGGATPTPDPPSESTPEPSPTPAVAQLLVSASANRDAAVPLAGQPLVGDVYVFVPAHQDVIRVRFYLDDPMRTREPYRIEEQAPYDLAGGTVQLARPLNVGVLSAGQHTVVAAAETAAGEDVVSAMFTVREPEPEPEPEPPTSPSSPAQAANLWIDTNGGTCTRQAMPGNYSDTTACASAQAAYDAARCGDTIRYKAGTAYATLSITGSGKASCTNGSRIIFRPEDDTPNGKGVASSVRVASISLSAANCYCEAWDFDTFADPLSSRYANTNGGQVSVTPMTGGYSNAEVSVNASVRRVDARNIFIRGSDVQVYDGSIGGWDVCDVLSDIDGLRIWGVNSASNPNGNSVAHRVTVDGLLIYDIRRSSNVAPCVGASGAFHTDAVHMFGGTGHVLRNIRIYNGPTQGIFGRPGTGDMTFAIDNLLVENNMVGQITDGTAGINVCNAGDHCTNVRYRNNTSSEMIRVERGATLVANNIAASWLILDATGVSNNVFTGTSSPGGTNAYACTPAWVSANPSLTGDFHMRAVDTCARGRGLGASSAATDFDGDARAGANGTYDIGADETG